MNADNTFYIGLSKNISQKKPNKNPTKNLHWTAPSQYMTAIIQI